MIDLPAIMSAASSATQILKDLKDIDRGINDAEYKLKIAELTGSVAEMKMAIAQLKEEIDEKNSVLRKLSTFLDEKKKLVRSQGYYYEASDDGKPMGLPFCDVCQIDGILIRLSRPSGGTRPKCPRCGAQYEADEFIWPEP